MIGYGPPAYLLVRIRDLAHALLQRVGHFVLAHGLQGFLFDFALQPGRHAEEEDVAAREGEYEDQAKKELTVGCVRLGQGWKVVEKGTRMGGHT